MITGTFVWLMLAAEPSSASGLPPEAAARNERGVALVNAGEVDAGIDELGRAYAAMPDPLKYRVGRGMVVGSLRSALMRRYAATGAPAHLCRLRGILHGHRSELLAALGAGGSAEDVAGTDAAIAEIDATLAGRPCETPPAPSGEPPVTPTQPPPEPPREVQAPRSEPRPAPPPLHPPGPGSARERRLRDAGAALLGVGGLATIGAVTAAAIYADRYRRLDALDRRLEGAAEIAEWRRLYDGGRQARTGAVVAGAVAGVLLVAGVAALTHRAASARRASLAPAIGVQSWGLHLSGRF